MYDVGTRSSFIKSNKGGRRHHSSSANKGNSNHRNSYEGKPRTGGTLLSKDVFEGSGIFSISIKDTNDGKAISLGTSKELFSFDFGKNKILVDLTAALTLSKKVFCRGESMALTSLYLFFFVENKISEMSNT